VPVTAAPVHEAGDDEAREDQQDGDASNEERAVRVEGRDGVGPPGEQDGADAEDEHGGGKGGAEPAQLAMQASDPVAMITG
jgi:hypothetical protein